MTKFLIVAGFFLVFPAARGNSQAGSPAGALPQSAGGHTFRVEQVASGLTHPWAITFLPDGRAVITERPGAVHLLEGGTLRRVSGVPSVQTGGQGGLLDVIPHGQFHENQLLYFSYATGGRGGSGTAIARARLEGTTLRQWEEIFRMVDLSGGGLHFGSRLAFLPDGTLLATIGDRGSMNRAQDRNDHAGSTIRINDDGSIPRDNPWVDTPGILPELYTWGNRNSQGMVVDRETGRVWQTEHGPRGGDELNIIEAGRNYGWPVISYGADYRTGRPIGEGTHREGMEQPVVYWTPALAPSGLILYTGDAFPRWRGNLFAGGLVSQQIRRLVVHGDTVTHQDVLLERQVGRIRDLAQGPDGAIYLITDQRDGAVFRIVPD